ncbi:MAG: NAD-dependent epimerase/dehydratase family protein [Patescibacteria group bacterium]|jgi:dihydroflavonol-4-reductase
MGKVLVTGAAGNIGSTLVRRLVERGEQVRVFLLPKTWHPFLDGLDIEKCYGDTTKEEDVLRAMDGCDQVYHLAGIVSYYRKDKKKIYAVNVGGTRNILLAAKKLKVLRVVVTASTSGIGVPTKKEWPLHEESHFHERYHRFPYLDSKYQTIRLCEQFAKEGVPVVMVSPTTVYGAGDIAEHIGGLIRRIENGILFVPPGGNAVVSVEDIVVGHILAMERGVVGENYIFANEFYTCFEMQSIIARILKVDPPRFIFSMALKRFYIGWFWLVEMLFGKKATQAWQAVALQCEHRYFDSTKARRDLGWVPQVSFSQAIREAFDFYRKMKK